MNNQQAIKLIQDRVNELIQNKLVQEKLIKMKQEGRTEQECIDVVQKIAIATLFGI